MIPAMILFRVTWDEHFSNGPSVPHERVTESLTEVQDLMIGLRQKDRYSNVKQYVAIVDWREA